MAEGNCQMVVWISNYNLAWTEIDQGIGFSIWYFQLRERFGSLDLMAMRPQLLVASFVTQQGFSEGFELWQLKFYGCVNLSSSLICFMFCWSLFMFILNGDAKVWFIASSGFGVIQGHFGSFLERFMYGWNLFCINQVWDLVMIVHKDVFCLCLRVFISLELCYSYLIERMLWVP